jgi:hypothetical protein
MNVAVIDIGRNCVKLLVTSDEGSFDTPEGESVNKWRGRNIKSASSFLLAALTMIFIGCAVPNNSSHSDFVAQTVLTDVWKDKDHRGMVKKIAVFWMAKAPENRLLAENEFVRQLKERGTAAIPFYVIIPPDKIVKRDVAVNMIRDLDVDAVLTLRVTDKRTAQSPIPAPDPADRTRLSDYYTYVYDTPTKDASDIAYLETNLIDVKSEHRIWTARSVTKVQEVNHQAVSDFIKLMIDRLASDGMIPQ